MKDNSRYNFKTIKLKPETYKKLVRFKASVEGEEASLHSFDKLIGRMLELLDYKKK